MTEGPYEQQRHQARPGGIERGGVRTVSSGNRRAFLLLQVVTRIRLDQARLRSPGGPLTALRRFRVVGVRLPVDEPERINEPVPTTRLTLLYRVVSDDLRVGVPGPNYEHPIFFVNIHDSNGISLRERKLDSRRWFIWFFFSIGEGIHFECHRVGV